MGDFDSFSWHDRPTSVAERHKSVLLIQSERSLLHFILLFQAVFFSFSILEVIIYIKLSVTSLSHLQEINDTTFVKT